MNQPSAATCDASLQWRVEGCEDEDTVAHTGEGPKDVGQACDNARRKHKRIPRRVRVPTLAVHKPRSDGVPCRCWLDRVAKATMRCSFGNGTLDGGTAWELHICHPELKRIGAACALAVQDSGKLMLDRVHASAIKVGIKPERICAWLLLTTMVWLWSQLPPLSGANGFKHKQHTGRGCCSGQRGSQKVPRRGGGHSSRCRPGGALARTALAGKKLTRKTIVSDNLYDYYNSNLRGNNIRVEYIRVL